MGKELDIYPDFNGGIFEDGDVRQIIDEIDETVVNEIYGVSITGNKEGLKYIYDNDPDMMKTNEALEEYYAEDGVVPIKEITGENLGTYLKQYLLKEKYYEMAPNIEQFVEDFVKDRE